MRRVLITALLLAGLTLPAHAFHDGGVGSCQGCHVMHQSEDGQFVPSAEGLLNGVSSSDLCLGCHAGTAGAVFGIDPLLPDTEFGGGNFIFLLEDNINDHQNGLQRPIAGEAAGHSIHAPGAGLMTDSRWALAPGGTFGSADLGCTSCHDPHGNGNFRMLYGAGDIQGGLYSFMAPAALAEGVQLGSGPEGASNHTAYQSGWAQWCGNCHGADYHDAGQGRFDHPVDVSLGADIANWYNLYLGDLNPAGGSMSTAYLPDVPFEDPAATTSSSAGPTASSRVTCISCHRVHGTSVPSAGRWDWVVDTLGDDGAISGSWIIPNPYLDPEQRSLCVKCHDVDHDNGKSCLNCHAPGQGGSGATVLPTTN